MDDNIINTYDSSKVFRCMYIVFFIALVQKEIEGTCLKRKEYLSTGTMNWYPFTSQYEDAASQEIPRPKLGWVELF